MQGASSGIRIWGGEDGARLNKITNVYVLGNTIASAINFLDYPAGGIDVDGAGTGSSPSNPPPSKNEITGMTIRYNTIQLAIKSAQQSGPWHLILRVLFYAGVTDKALNNTVENALVSNNDINGTVPGVNVFGGR